MTRVRAVAALAAVALAVIAGLRLAGSEVRRSPDAVAASVSAQVMSPYCPGVTLHDCPSARADELRARIAGLARSGLEEKTIVDRLASEFGDSIRAAPTGTGLAAVTAWVVPVTALVAGIIIALFLARRWTRESTSLPEVSAVDRARIERELTAMRTQP